MNKKNIVLFDMDGTLTEARGNFNTELMLDLRQLSKYADIGILTGSDLEYVNEQMKKLIRFSELRFVTHLLPCNGTKHYAPPNSSQEDYRLVHTNDMSKELTQVCLREIFKIITQHQHDACYHGIPLTGHFVNYRGSMINWCPIGRNATPKQRKQFVEYDKAEGFRKNFLTKLQTKIDRHCPGKVEVKLGGDTSFDIYPTGWNKTYALRHFQNQTAWFVGDRCEPSGNDYEIYEQLGELGRAFKTTDPVYTGAIIREELIPKLKHL